MALSDKYGDQALPVVPRKEWKGGTEYSEEQKFLLEEHFDQCMQPSLVQHVAMTLVICVTEYETLIWFKNHLAKYKHKNSQNVPVGLQEINGSSKAVAELTWSPGLSSAVASDNGEPLCQVANPDQSIEIESRTDPAVAEAPVAMAAATKGPEDAQDSGPSSGEL